MSSSRISDFYRDRMKKYAWIRVPKELFWTVYHRIKWFVIPCITKVSGHSCHYFRWRIMPRVTHAELKARRFFASCQKFLRRLPSEICRTGRSVQQAWLHAVHVNRQLLRSAGQSSRSHAVSVSARFYDRVRRYFGAGGVLRAFARALIPREHLLQLRRTVAFWRSSIWQYWKVRPMPLRPYGQAGAKVRHLAAAAETVVCNMPAVNPPALLSVVQEIQTNYRFPAVEVLNFFNAEVCGSSNFVFCRGAALHHDLYDFAKDFTSEELHGRYKVDLKARRLSRAPSGAEPLVLDSAAVFTDSLASNYAHWLTEVLPRMHALQLAGVPLPPVVLIDADLHRNIEASAELVVGPGVRFERLEKARIAKVRRLTVVTPAGYIPFEPRPGSSGTRVQGIFHPQIFKSMRSRLGHLLGKAAETPKKIFLRRNSKYRSLLNEADVARSLEGAGFVQVYPEQLSFSDQYRIFSGANCIVGATGAAFANIVFCQPGIKIIICISSHPGHSYGYWQSMACASGNSVSYVLGPVQGPESHGLHADFTVDVCDVASAVAEADCQRDGCLILPRQTT